ncbi:MAG TPA: hypothetical protein VFU31_27770 [Candidatus Binatia bacterium]|nr:hypothetical protein [Candidatus Binatia bacterium]
MATINIFATKMLARLRRNQKNLKFYHEAHEEHEGKKYFFLRCDDSYPIFVSFATFVVIP